jgi:hypothetical protein
VCSLPVASGHREGVMRGGEDEAERADQHDRGEQRERPLATPGRGKGASVSETRDAFMPPSGLGRRWRSHGLAAGEQCPAVVKQHHAVCTAGSTHARDGLRRP